jgi:predicted dehydrogenase
MVTYGSHPYTGKWWAPGHIVGYETAFVNAAYDYLTALGKGTKISPSFSDGVRIMQVLEAAQKSAAEGRKVKVSEIK